MVKETKASKLVQGLGDRISESVSKGTTGRAGGTPAPSRHIDPKDVGRQNDRHSMLIELDRLMPDPDQPRKVFSDESLDRLSRSLATKGQAQAISVRWSPTNEKWMIIAGERRYQAAKKAGFKTLRATIKEITDSGDLLAEQVAENTARDDLAPMDQANAFRTLIDDYGWTQQRLAEELGLSQATIAQRLALVGADETVQDAVRNGEISATTAYAVSRAPAEAQAAIVQEVVDNDLNRAEAQAVVEKAITKAGPKKAGPKKSGGKKSAKVIGLETSRTIRTASKIKVTADRSKGFDLATLREALREAADQVDAEIRRVEGMVEDVISG